MSAATTTRAAAILPHGDWRRRFPPVSVCLLTLFCLSLVPVAQLCVDEVQAYWRFYDGAAANIFSLLFGFLAAFTLYVWFTWWSVYSFRTRRIVFATPLVGIAVACAALRYEGVDGYMKPTFSPRWIPRHVNTFVTSTSPVGSNSTLVSANDNPSEKLAPVPVKNSCDLRTEAVDDFPQFLGPNRSNYLPGRKLAGDWQATPPKELWRREVGAGWSGFVVRNGFAVTVEQRGNEEWITCYHVATGEPVWHHAAPGKHHEPLGGTGPRSTPTIEDGLVYVQGVAGLVRCLDGQTGQLVWQDDQLQRYQLTQAEFEAEVSWGHAASPLIVGDLVICTACGRGETARSLIAYHKRDGKVAWEAGHDQLSYASPAVATIGGVRQVVYVSEKLLSSFDLESGKQLWQYDWPGHSNGSATASQAIPLGDDRVFVSKGYGIGGALLKIVKSGDSFAAETVWQSRRVLKTKFTNVSIIEGHVYGLSDGVLECVDLETGKQKWRGGRYGHGQVLGVGDKLLVIGEAGDLMLVAASPEKFQQLGKIDALSDKAWNNLCLTGNRLLIRNGKEAVCYELP